MGLKSNYTEYTTSLFTCISRILHDPLGKNIAAKSFFAGRRYHHNAPFFHGMLRIIDGFLGLIQVNIFRKTGSGHNNIVNIKAVCSSLGKHCFYILYLNGIKKDVMEQIT